MKTEIEILREFVEEFAPFYQGQTENLTYNELFSIVAEIVETHKEGLQYGTQCRNS
jgi:hypothetical protein